MTPRADPYRVLGLVAGASPGEIRSAYRRLAKLNHPDTAGDRSLPRFLAIRAAYEQLVDDEGKLRVRGWPGRGGAGGGERSPSPSARGASRDAWRARRAGGASGGASARDSASADGSARPKSGGGTKTGAGRTRSGERRTARPGSTTYDEAAQPLDPSWDGALWYGASSGRYWTLNPREYADPRKHGPEYQARARRASRLEAARHARGDRADGAQPSEADPATDGDDLPAGTGAQAEPRSRRPVRRGRP